MFSVDGVYEVPFVQDEEGKIFLSCNFLFFKDQIVFDTSKKEVILTRKSLFKKRVFVAPYREVVIKLENDYVGGVGGYQFMFKHAVTLVIKGQRIQVARQNGANYAEEYLEKLLCNLGDFSSQIKIERTYSP